MSDWLDPLRAALDAAPDAKAVFVRDDDAGWDDARLFALLDLFERHGAPIDLAVIPTELTPGLAAELRRRRAATDGSVGLHQHGYSHANHQVEGRKCEFGAARSFAAQRRDLVEGQAILGEAFGDELDPIFTPPWNRCTSDTGAALVELGIAVLSRDMTADPLNVSGLGELVVQVDWFAAHKGTRLTREALGVVLADRVAAPAPLGVMLHHAVMDDTEMDAADELLSVVCRHPNVTLTSMAQLTATTNLTHEEVS